MQRGFQIIEMLVIAVVISIFVAVFATFATGFGASKDYSVGINGIVEQRCINGYLFTVSYYDTRQVYDQFGHGMLCK